MPSSACAPIFAAELPAYMQPREIVWRDALPIVAERQGRPGRAGEGVRMKAMGPIPPGFVADAGGQLLIGGRTADELVAEAGGTPLFVYDSNLVGTADRPLPRRDACGGGAALCRQGKSLRAIAHMDCRQCRRLRRRFGRRAWAGSPHLGLPISFAGPGKTRPGARNGHPRRRHHQSRKRRRGGARAGHRRRDRPRRRSSPSASTRRSRSRAPE